MGAWGWWQWPQIPWPGHSITIVQGKHPPPSPAGPPARPCLLVMAQASSPRGDCQERVKQAWLSHSRFLSRHFHFASEESEAQRGGVTALWSHSGGAKDLGAWPAPPSRKPGRGVDGNLSLSFFLSQLILIHLLVSVFADVAKVRFPRKLV